uniref:hypothetical protein n=1 Tax=Lawsonella clevelandensis TaxID=1528099 RepID=UPI0023EF9691
MQVNNEHLRELCEKLERVIQNIDPSQFDRCSFSGLFSELASAQSVFAQVTQLAEGPHGLIKGFEWHVCEGHCVSAALRSQCDEISRIDSGTKEAFDAVYQSEAAKRNHECCCPTDTSGLGKGYSAKNGKRLRSYTGCGTPLVEEPIWSSVDKLANAFAIFDTGVFFECASAWKASSELLRELSTDIHKIGAEIQNCGSWDAYTYEAGAGIRRWADSIWELSEQSAKVGKHLATYSVNYSNTRTEVNAIADEADIDYKQDVIANRMHDVWTYDNKANAVLQEKYNPQLKNVDSHDIEFPVPMRAFRPDHLVHIPDPPKPALAALGGVFDPPPIAASPAGAKSVLAQPVVPPPDTTDI